ncbi:hypothetical protein MNBD_NITROSPINAE01-326 [hydrothermal vent metagenome]|uniref:Uncharacterized protein n=1 Tax=hydrothermal vent metagenome TaxID=652676 RepID=A0A3B1BW81_9ZZZZ
MTKTIEDAVQKSKERLKGLGNSEGELSAEQRKKLRDAKKQLKRAQRTLRVNKTLTAKKEEMATCQQKNIETAKEKEAKRKHSKETALAEAAEKQAKDDAALEAAKKAAEEAKKEETPAEKSE